MFLLFYAVCFWSIWNKREEIVMVLGGQHDDIMAGLIWFPEMRVFRMWFFLTKYLKSRRGTSVHGRIPWGQNRRNPCAQLIISFFCLYMCFFMFWTNMKNDDFRSQSGVTTPIETVIFMKLQGGVRGMMTHGWGRFGRAPVMVLVIFKLALGRQEVRLAWPLWALKIHWG